MDQPIIPWSIKKTSQDVHRLELKFDKSGDTRWLLLTSDIHWDSVSCDREKLKKDLDLAAERQAAIFVFGDLLDLMQGKYDPRSNKKDLRPELLASGKPYLDECIGQAAEWYKPYRDYLALVSAGNHESSVSQRVETDIIGRFCEELKIEAGGYWGFVQLQASYGKSTETKSLMFHHGYGGGGEITRGLIDQSRTRSQYYADFYVSGHIHRRNCDENVIQALDRLGNVEERSQWFLRCASYKRERHGWHAEKGRAGRPIGGWWISCQCHRKHDTTEWEWTVYPS